ncbi:enhancer of polycomb homolog 1 [Coccinella septempunctata]|uniref:enhancer of polycomb homolog 1 n=1 Tax=Coccinella septempunctata TaxID=41139 RepID=UPI001D07AC16|nr:enhancer of polycomb homolog 1 [Coccinella septempunctata]
MSKLSFRARALDASKPMPIYMAEELPDLPDYSAINRAVPQMPSGMEKEEECEHHLQRAICAGLIIPTPEVSDIPQNDFYDKVYPSTYKQPRQLIYMQPFTMEHDIPDYDMDSDDEIWLQSQTQRLDLTPLKFEEMMDRLEKSSGQTVVTLNEAKALLKEDDDLIIAVFDYWLNKRLKTQHPLILSVKTEQRAGTAANNPYLAFRRRTEKMQTRKNRKNDEVSYEKMLKLKRDFCRAVTLLELIKRREKMKRENVHLTVEIFEKRYHARDFSGTIFNEVSSIKTSSRPAFTPIFHNHYTNQSWTSKTILKDEGIPRKEKRQYKKRKHKASHNKTGGLGQDVEMAAGSSDEELGAPAASPEPEDTEDEGQFAFRRNKLCSYHMPLPQLGNWPWCSKEENGSAFRKFRYNLTSVTDRLHQRRRCIGFARRRVGRGGRIILDRASTTEDDEFWRTLDFTILENEQPNVINVTEGKDMLTNNEVSVKPDNSSTGNVQILQTEVKNEIGDNVRISNGSSVSEMRTEVKVEPMDYSESDVQQLNAPLNVEPPPTYAKEEEQQMLEFLQSVRKEWLHFRPKTPPPEQEPVCNLQPLEESYWKVGSTSPFSLEIQCLDSPSALLDTSAFVSDQFNFDNLGSLDIPITDTRQPSDKIVQTGINLNVNVGINTLTPSVNNDNSSFNLNHVDGKSDATNTGSDRRANNDKTIGCSKFNVSDLNASSSAPSSKFSTCTFASRKFNSINQASDGQLRPNSDAAVNNTNGILPQYGYEKSTGRMKNNKMSYAFPSGMEYTNATPGISLHTSAHTLTLNSHSANIFEIPISNNTDSVSTDSVNSQCTDTSGTTSNNKNKTIVRKNNLAMEVT